MTLTPDDVRNATFHSRKRGKRGYDESEVDAFLERVEAALRGEDSLTPEEILDVVFSPRRRGKRAYVEEEVDALLDAAAQALLESSQLARSRPQQHETAPSPGPPGTTTRQVPATQRRQNPTLPARKRPETTTVQVHPAQDKQHQTVPTLKQPATPAQQVRATPVTPPTARPQSIPATAPTQEDAYDADQVDAFLDRVEATLRGEDTLTAQDLLTVKFGTARPGGRACPKPGVDAFLIQVALSLQQLSGHTPRSSHQPGPSRPGTPSPLVAAELQDLTFSCPPPGYPAYDQRQVDSFLRRVEATLRGEDNLTPHEVDSVRFSPPPQGTRGYAEREVEALLDLVREHLGSAVVRGA